MGRKPKKLDMRIKDEFQEVKQRIAIAKETFNRKISIIGGALEKELRKRLVDEFYVECSVVWCRDLDSTKE